MAQCKTHIVTLGGKPKTQDELDSERQQELENPSQVHVPTLGGGGLGPMTPAELDQVRRSQVASGSPPPPIVFTEVRSERIEEVRELLDADDQKVGEVKVGVQYTMEDQYTGQRVIWAFDRTDPAE